MNSLRIIGAIGTAIMITIMAIVRTNYANHATHQSKTEIMQHATVLGVDAPLHSLQYC